MKNNKNYLEKVPVISPGISYTTDENGIVTLEIENKGVFNFLAQKILKKPRISFIHLEKTGSFVWKNIDGVLSVGEIAQKVDQHFGEEAHPLYERLVKYFTILESYHFIRWEK